MLFLNGLCLTDAVGTGLAEGETGQAEPDWPALADWLPNAPMVPFFAYNQDLFRANGRSPLQENCIIV